MGSGNKLTKIIADITERNNKAERLAHETIDSWEILKTGILRQKVYLGWTAALAAMHILEVWILIRFQYAYPPPSGLTALRVISSFSLIGLFGALSFKWADFDAQIGQPAHSSVRLRLSRLFDSARMLFITAAFGSLLVGLWVVLFSKLQLSSPPAFRAVIFSGILGLPIDVTATFLLYLSGTVCALPVSKRLRILTLTGTTVGLFFLALDLPILYLVFTITPRIYLLNSVWRNISGQSLRHLFFLPKRVGDINPSFKQMFKHRLYYNSATQIIFDFGFLALFNRLGHFEAGISLLLYLVHKSAHLSMVLLGKSHLSLVSGIKSAILIGETPRLKYLLRTLTVLGAFYVALAFAFTPLFLIQRSTTQWLSPTGEWMAVDPMLMLIGLFLTLNCLLINLATTFAFYRKFKWAVVASISFIAGSWIIRLACPAIVHYLNARHALVLFGVFQGGFAAFLLLHARRRLFNGASCQPAAQPIGAARICTVSSLIRNLDSTLNKGEGICVSLFAVTFFRGKQWDPPEVLELLSGVISVDDTVTVWGARTLLISTKRSDAREISTLRVNILKSLAGYIESMKFCLNAGGTAIDFLGALFQTVDPASALYELGSNRHKAAPTPESMDAVRALENWHSHPQELPSTAILSKYGMYAVQVGGNWGLDSLMPLETRINARRFLRSLYQRQEFIAPDTANQKDFSGFIHLNRDNKPCLLIFIPLEKRESLAALRFEAFRINFDDAVNFKSAINSF